MNDIDLVLDKIPDTDEDALVGEINKYYGLDINKKVERAATWMQSIHFYAGNQWIRYSNRDRKWEQIPFTQTNRNIDRPVTNHILRLITINAAAFTNKPSYIVDPNSEEPEDKTSARMAEVVIDFLYEALDKSDGYMEAALWGLICGTVFRKSYKDYTGRFVTIPGGNDPLTGAPINDSLPIKRVAAEIVSPFNISIDAQPKRFTDLGTIMEASLKRVEWVKAMYSQDAPGYTGKAEEVTEDQQLTNPITLAESVKNIVEMNGQNHIGFDSNVIIKECCVVKEVYCRPSRNFPKGRMIVVAGNKLMYRGETPYFYQGGKFWHPYTYWVYQRMPGNVWGLSLVQQLIPMQRRINSIDALLAYNRKTVAVGTWLIPSGCNIPDGQLVGVPGQNVIYDSVPSGERPHKEVGVPLPDQIVQERDIILRDMGLLANSADLRGGQNPRGVSTLGQLEILSEQANQSMSKIVDSWEKFVEESEIIDLLNFQSVYQFPDNEISAGLAKLSKDVTKQEWSTFTGKDLRDNTTVRVEKGSTIARSRILRQNTIIKLAQLNLLGDIVGDPINHKIFLEEFGLAKLYNENNVDVKKAEKVIELMLTGEYPPVLEIDNPDIQMIVLARYMKHPKYMELPDDIKLLFERRKDEYIQMLADVNAVPDYQDGNGRLAQPSPGKPPKLPRGMEDSTQSAVTL